jgi:DNA polymerase-3 subunit gamma/tau
MFASTEPSGFPPAILSRLQRYDVRRLSIPEIEGKLSRILEADGRTVEPAALTLIARLAAGGMRDAESILDQLLTTTTDVVTEAGVRDLLGLADAAAVDGFVTALETGDIAAGVEILDRLEERGRDPRALLDQVVDVIRIRLVDPATVDPRALADVARRLVAIDPDRAGIGGLRLQLELALFAGTAAPSESVADPPRPALPPAVPSPEAAAPSPAVPAPEGDPATPIAAEPQAPAVTEPTSSGPTPAVKPTGPLPTPKPATTLKAAAKPGPAKSEAVASAPSSAPAQVEEAAPPPTAGAAAPPAADDPTPRPAPERAPVAVPIAVGDDLDRLLDRWPEIVQAVSPATRAVLTECRPIGIDGNVVTLGFPEAKSFLKDHAERRRQDVETAVGGLLGRPVSVKTVATNIEVAPMGAADDLVAEARRIFGEDLVDVAEIE